MRLATPERVAEQARIRIVEKQVAPPPASRDMLAPDLRLYLLERRRALLTELASLNKLLGLPVQ
jgi:hypothetical protein